MYQIEVKLGLIEHAFNPSVGWVVHCHLDGMELGKGQQQAAAKREIAEACMSKMSALGAMLACHTRFPRADIVAIKASTGEVHLIEVEGTSTRQREQAVYSALGQVLFKMCDAPELGRLAYGLAVPDEPRWRTMVERIPAMAREALALHVYLVSGTGVTHVAPPSRSPA